MRTFILLCCGRRVFGSLWLAMSFWGRRSVTSRLKPLRNVCGHAAKCTSTNTVRKLSDKYLSREAVRVARQNPRTTDFTQNILRRALKETIACFPVYRTYVDCVMHDEADERYIHWAITQATRNEQEVDASVFAFLEQLLSNPAADSTGRR